MNQVILIGNLTRDPDLKYTTGQNQTAVCRFALAIEDGYGDKKKVSYPSIVVFGKAAENCDKYLAKGKKCAVVGKIQTGSYEKDGRKIYTTDVVANSVEFLSSAEKKDNSQADEGNPWGTA